MFKYICEAGIFLLGKHRYLLRHNISNIDLRFKRLVFMGIHLHAIRI